MIRLAWGDYLELRKVGEAHLLLPCPPPTPAPVVAGSESRGAR